MTFLNSPFIHDQKIILCEDNNIINNSNEVSNLFNNFFATVAEKIGENVVYDPSNLSLFGNTPVSTVIFISVDS
jgi:hypothetical protein